MLRRRNSDAVEVVATDLAPPVNGVLPLKDGLIVSVGGCPARLVRIEYEGSVETLVEGFPGPGNYHLNMAAAGPDNFLYFGVGAMTNTGVVGPDGLGIGWLPQLRHAHDVPGLPIDLVGQNFSAKDPTTGEQAETGAFSPFGQPTSPGQVLRAGMPATASVLRCRQDGSGLELVAWGIRNAYGLGFLTDGRLLALDQGADDRGSRPVDGVPDFLFEVKTGAWYGWPDFMGGVPITDPAFTPKRGPAPRFVLANHDRLPPAELPLVRFPAHSAPTKFAVIPDSTSRCAGHLLVTLFGDERPMTASEGPPVGRILVRVDPSDWSVHRVPSNGMVRPIDVEISAETNLVYVLDFGAFEIGGRGSFEAEPGTGMVWRCALDELVATI